MEEGVAWKKVVKNGDEIPDNAELQVLDTTEAKYISRGGLKLEGALKTAGLDVSGLRCLDIGQQTPNRYGGSCVFTIANRYCAYPPVRPVNL